MTIHLDTPISINDIKQLHAGEVTFISGIIYTARDQAHAKIVKDQKRLPFDLEGACIYHSGPLIIKVDATHKVVAAGPTTSARMDRYIPDMVRLGVRAIIGKGGVFGQAIRSMRGRCLYLAFTGGCGAFAQKRIVEVVDVYYQELGDTEAVWKLRVRDFGPLIVGVDATGRSLYEEVETYARGKLRELLP